VPGPILLVFAHPDDETSSAAGTTARYARHGVTVDLVCATGGEKGTRLDVPPDIATASAREKELRAAAGITGIRDIYLLGYIDGELEKANAGEVAGRVLDIMMKVRPEVVITFGPDGVSGHPDHIAIGRAATAAFKKITESGGGPRKLYYVTIPRSAFSGTESDGAEGVITRPDDEITTVIDIAEIFDIKIRALESYRSQQDARWLVEMFRQVGKSGWAGRECYFLASQKTPVKETDLFD
jgi:LmbE family N-acetylglucosaminyl deacetylase